MSVDLPEKVQLRIQRLQDLLEGERCREAIAVVLGVVFVVGVFSVVRIRARIRRSQQDPESACTTQQDRHHHRHNHRHNHHHHHQSSRPLLPRIQTLGPHYYPRNERFMGNPAALDKITRLIRRTCPLSIARVPGKCGLCGQDIYESDSIRTLPCSHTYHNLCVLQWLVISQLACPECNEDIPDK